MSRCVQKVSSVMVKYILLLHFQVVFLFWFIFFISFSLSLLKMLFTSLSNSSSPSYSCCFIFLLNMLFWLSHSSFPSYIPFPSLPAPIFYYIAPGLRERPSSAIYPSDSFRQTLLGSRRGRSSLSLSKSVSTNNISGWVIPSSFRIYYNKAHFT